MINSSSSIQHFCHKCHYTVRSLTYNHFMDQSYAADVFMEPLFWFVDNFTQAIGIVSKSKKNINKITFSYIFSVFCDCCNNTH